MVSGVTMMAAHSKKLTAENLPTTHASAVRLRFFQPSTKPVYTSTELIETPWGWCQVDGQLGQTHADVIDAMMVTAIRLFKEDDGRLQLLIDPYAVRKVVGGGSQCSYKGLCDRLDDIMRCLVRWESKCGRLAGVGHIIDAYTKSKETRHNPFGGQRELWKVTIGAAWAKLIEDDLGLYYDPVVIAKLNHGISKAVARIMLSHDPKRQPHGINIETMLDWLCINKDARRDARRNLKKYAPELESVGVIVSSGKIKVRQP